MDLSTFTFFGTVHYQYWRYHDETASSIEPAQSEQIKLPVSVGPLSDIQPLTLTSLNRRATLRNQHSYFPTAPSNISNMHICRRRTSSHPVGVEPRRSISCPPPQIHVRPVQGWNKRHVDLQTNALPLDQRAPQMYRLACLYTGCKSLSHLVPSG